MIAEHNQELVDTLNARTFAMAQGVDGAAGMMNICSTCQGAQSECQERLDADAGYREHINGTSRPRASPTRATQGWWNKNFLWLLVEEIGIERLAEKVVRPLSGLRIAPFYGCYIVRPTKRLGFDEHPKRDRYLDVLIDVLGAEPVEYAGSHKCCGFPLDHDEPDDLPAPGGTSLGRRPRRRCGLPGHPLPAVPPQPGHAAARRRAVRGT